MVFVLHWLWDITLGKEFFVFPMLAAADVPEAEESSGTRDAQHDGHQFRSKWSLRDFLFLPYVGVASGSSSCCEA